MQKNSILFSLNRFSKSRLNISKSICISIYKTIDVLINF